jgi:hypothetical protein
LPTLKLVEPITESRLESWIRAQGGEERIWIRPILGRDVRAVLSFKTDQGKREAIIQWISRGGRLDTFLREFKGSGIKGLTDIIACLNGGYSPSKDTWGTQYIELTTDPLNEAK